MNPTTEFEKWLAYKDLDSELRAELECIKGNEEEIKERFSNDLEFGTGGLRSVIRAGSNGMNIYTVRRATQGLADLINKLNGASKGVAIAYDSRIKSDLFAKEAACVLAANGIKAYLFDSLRPTPELSFAIRYLGTIAGIVVTASHNPSKYNGYKAYWSDGGQLPPKEADEVLAFINDVDIFGAKTVNYDQAINDGMIEIIGDDVDEAYYKAIANLSVNPDVWKDTDLSVVYTPFHGAGNIPVRTVLTRMGLKNLTVVKEQELPDGRFPTVASPNPEYSEGFEIALGYAKKVDADIIIGTDPDSDRTGLLLKNADGNYDILNGNQIGVLIALYVLDGMKSAGKLPNNGAIIKTIVTTNMIKPIAKDYGAVVMDVLTGFKFIGEKIKQFEDTGSNTYLLGFEESFGYLTGTHARDKDAVNSCMIICEAAAFYKKQGKTLMDVINDAYEKYGYYREALVQVTHEGLSGLEKIKNTMTALRNNPPKEFKGVEVVSVYDYNSLTKITTGVAESIEGLPAANVLAFELKDGTTLTIRPSGTEPKIKSYVMTVGKTNDEALANVEKYKEALSEILN